MDSDSPAGPRVPRNQRNSGATDPLRPDASDYAAPVAVSASFVRRYRASLAIVVLVAGVRTALAVAGVGFDLSGLTGRVDYYQLLDTQQLQHHLASSIWNLQSQPPLLDLWSGLLLQLPHGWIPPVMYSLSVLLSLALALSTYHLCLALRVPVALSAVVTVLVVVDPANLLYSSWYFDTYPTAVALTFGALCLARLVRGRSRLWAAGYLGSLSVVVLLNSTFQWVWLVAAVLPVIGLWRHNPRRLVVMLALPVLVMGGWYAKNAVLFNTYTTSSWIGMNMAKVSLGTAGPGRVEQLVADGTLTPISLHLPFAPLQTYAGLYTPRPQTGAPVLDRPTKQDGTPNYNAADYLPIASQYLHDDLAYIAKDPAGYTKGVEAAVRLFFFPSDRYFFLWPEAIHMTAYQSTYDAAVDWDIRPNGFALVVPHPSPRTPAKHQVSNAQSWDQISISAALAFAVLLVLAPLAAWLRRADRGWVATMGFTWMTSAYVLVLTSLADLGENLRFRYDLGPLPLVGAVATIVALAVSVRFRAVAAEDPPTG